MKKKIPQKRNMKHKIMNNKCKNTTFPKPKNNALKRPKELRSVNKILEALRTKNEDRKFSRRDINNKK